MKSSSLKKSKMKPHTTRHDPLITPDFHCVRIHSTTFALALEKFLSDGYGGAYCLENRAQADGFIRVSADLVAVFFHRLLSLIGGRSLLRIRYESAERVLRIFLYGYGDLLSERDMCFLAQRARWCGFTITFTSGQTCMQTPLETPESQLYQSSPELTGFYEQMRQATMTETSV